MKNVVLNAIQFKQQSSGIGLMIYNLFQNLIMISPELTFTVLLSQDSPNVKGNNHCHIIRIPYKKNQTVKRNIYENFQIAKYCHHCIYISCDSKLPLRLPKTSYPLLFVTDLAVFRMKEVYQTSRVLYWMLMFQYSIRKAKKVLAISQFTKNEIVDVLRISPNKIDVIYCAANEGMHCIENPNELDSIKMMYNLPPNFFLFVGNFNPRKNLVNIIRAFDQFKVKDNQDYKLVIVGEKGWKFQKEKALESIKHKEDIIFPGYIPDVDLPAFYSLSSALVFPTLYEGFGIPPIEAQVCHTPVIAANTSCFQEICGDGAVFVNPYSVENISDAMYQLVHNQPLRDTLVQNGIHNSQRFSWKNSAEQLKQVILQAE